MTQAIISFGSNLGDRKKMLSEALERISFANKIVLVSDVYEAFPKHGSRYTPYLNACAVIETDMTSHQLLGFLKETERQLNGSRPEEELMLERHIDIDLIDYGHKVMRTPELTLPHPDAHRRAFVMIPLAEIKPEWEHPVLHRKARELAQESFWSGWGTFFASGQSLLDF